MGFYNYGARNNLNRNVNKENSNEEVLEETNQMVTNDGILSLDSILNQPQQIQTEVKEEIKIEKELIDYPRMSKIEGFNSISLPISKIGELTTMYDRQIEETSAKSMVA